jgi:Na+/melibiose symporter-like transporter
VAVVMGLVCIGGCLAHYFTTKERIRPIHKANERLSFKRICGMLLRSRAWVLNTLYVLCYGVINLMLMSCITYYATYIMGSTAAATMIQAAYLITSLLASFLVSPIDKALGRKKTMILAVLIFILGKVWFIADPYSAPAIYINAITVGIAVTITFVMFNTNRNNIVDLIEWKEGHRLDSMVSTVDNLASKSATAIATLVITGSLSSQGFDASLPRQPDGAINTINAFLGWVPMLIGVAMLVVVCFLNIDTEMKRMAEEKTGSV